MKSMIGPIVLAILVLCGTFNASADEKPPRAGNAAVHYWAAAAMMRQPENDREEELRDYIETWQGLPPEVFAKNAEAMSFLDKDLAPKRAFDMLHLGASRKACDFDVAPGDPDFINLGILRSLARRALAASELLESKQDNVGAARIIADSIELGKDLGQCPKPVYAMSGWAILASGLGEAREFMTRNPGVEPLRLLMDSLEQIESRPFAFPPMIEYYAAETTTALANVSLSDEELDEALEYLKNGIGSEVLREFGLFPQESSIRYLRNLGPEERERVLRHWVEQMTTELRGLAEDGEGSFIESHPRVVARGKRMAEMGTPPSPKEIAENPLMHSVSFMSNLHGQAAFNNALLAMHKVLCASALFEAETGEYPDSMEPLRKYFPSGFPTDPFTDEELVYSLEDGMPAIECRPPEDLGEGVVSRARISLSEALRKQAEFVERYRQQTAD
jgi:hypothetical protein